MDLLIIGGFLAFVIWLYFSRNPLQHSRKFMVRRFWNWFPMGMTYAFLYMARYNLNVSKNAFGDLMSKEDFGIIFAAGTITYGLSFLLNGPLVDKMGGKKGIIIAALGSSLCNLMMGIATFMYLQGGVHLNLTLTFSILYAMNMFFQSYGAVSIIKVKAYWFHVRERGIFGAIFGTLISFGVYFAFDWGEAIVNATKLQNANPTPFAQFLRTALAIDTGRTDATWFVFFIPSAILVFWALVDMWILKDTPSQAKFEDFDTHDASSDEMDRNFTIRELLHRIFTSPILLTISLIEFCGGVLRNGIMQWYSIFAKEIPQVGAEVFTRHWGLWLCISGILGGFTAGIMSDVFFQSRRGPPVAICNFVMFLCMLLMSALLFTSPWTIGFCAIAMQFAVIGVHSLMSGTAAADFGGRKATATASGIVDGFVYLGSGVQSLSLGFLVTKSWQFWPLFLVPFTVVGFVLSLKIWQSLPEATKKYMASIQVTESKIVRRFSFRRKKPV
jgi:OPA family glycerol-3-phosphate transporter-like MFS transporter